MHCYQMSVLISRHSWPSLPLFFMNAFSYWLWLLHTLFLITLLICRQLWLYTVHIHDSERPVIPVQNKQNCQFSQNLDADQMLAISKECQMDLRWNQEWLVEFACCDCFGFLQGLSNFSHLDPGKESAVRLYFSFFSSWCQRH